MDRNNDFVSKSLLINITMMIVVFALIAFTFYLILAKDFGFIGLLPALCAVIISVCMREISKEY